MRVIIARRCLKTKGCLCHRFLKATLCRSHGTWWSLPKPRWPSCPPLLCGARCQGGAEACNGAGGRRCVLSRGACSRDRCIGSCKAGPRRGRAFLSYGYAMQCYASLALCSALIVRICCLQVWLLLMRMSDGMHGTALSENSEPPPGCLPLPKLLGTAAHISSATSITAESARRISSLLSEVNVLTCGCPWHETVEKAVLCQWPSE